MITEGEYQDYIKLAAFDRLDGLIWHGVKSLCIDKKQAAQLFEVLQHWVNGEEIE